MSKTKIQSLRLIIGGDKGSIFEVRDGETLTIGRDPGCDIQLNHQSISPIHCKVSYNNEVFRIVDLDSSSGILFKNRKVKRMELREDTTFSLGKIKIATCSVLSLIPFKVSVGKKKSFTFTPDDLQFEQEVTPSQPDDADDPKTFRERFSQAIKQMPILGTSILFHLIVFILVADLPFLSQKFMGIHQICANLVSSEDEVKFEEDIENIEYVFDPPEVQFEDLFEASDPWEEELTAEVIPIPADSGIIGISSGRPGMSGLAGEGIANLNTGSISSALSKYITDLRKTGMDVVFIIDNTSSMVPFLESAKWVVNKLISKLAAVVPNLRLSIIGYRDKGDQYITRHLDLTEDRYEILNFLEDCQAEGGGDFPEAIYEALSRAINTLLWREKAVKIIVLLGDAPYHRETETGIEKLLRDFKNKSTKAQVNTVYVGRIDNPPSGNQKNAITCFKHIAQISSGEYSQSAENNRILNLFFRMVFDSRWAGDLEKLSESVKKDRMTRLVERKARSGQIEWLVKGLTNVPVRAGIADALIETADSKVLSSLVQYLVAEEAPIETRWAAFYIIRKVLGKKLSYNPYSNREKQNKDIILLQKAISDFQSSLK